MSSPSSKGLVWCVLSAAACAPPPTPDGAWGGTAVCEDNTNRQVEAVFDTHEDGGLDGLFVIDLPLDFGVLGEVITVQRATIRDGEAELAGTWRLSGFADRDPAMTGGETRNYGFDLESDEEVTELEGSLDWVNGEGDSVQACEITLDPLHTTD